jgi:hypothetical protein
VTCDPAVSRTPSGRGRRSAGVVLATAVTASSVLRASIPTAIGFTRRDIGDQHAEEHGGPHVGADQQERGKRRAVGGQTSVTCSAVNAIVNPNFAVAT